MAIQFPKLKKTPKDTATPMVSLASPYAAPTANMDIDVGEDNTDYTDNKFYSPTGRMGRIQYLFYPLACLLGALILGGGIAIMLGAGDGSFRSMPISLAILVVVLLIALVYINVVVSVRRLHDLNRSGWLALLLFVPVINNIFPLYLTFAPGDKGFNNYGLPASPPPTWMKILTPLLFIGVIGAYVGMAMFLTDTTSEIEPTSQTTTANAPVPTPTAEPTATATPSAEPAMPAPTGNPPLAGDAEKPLMVEPNQGATQNAPAQDAPSNTGANFAEPTATPAPSDKSKEGNISDAEFIKLSEGTIYSDPVHVKK